MPRKGLFISTQRELEPIEQLLLQLAPQYFDFEKINYNNTVADAQLTETEISLCVLQSIHVILLVNDRMKWDARCSHFGTRFKNRGADMRLTFTDTTGWTVCNENDTGRGSRIQRNAEGMLMYMQATFTYSPHLRQILWATLERLATDAHENHVVLDALMKLAQSLYWCVRDGDIQDTRRRATARSHELCGRIADRVEELNGPRHRGEDSLDSMMRGLMV